MPVVAIVSFRLGGPDGVSVVADQWAWALRQLGCSVRTVAGRGPVDVHVPGLAWPSEAEPMPGEVADAVAGCDLVVVENVCSLPLHPAASAAVAGARRGLPTILHHYDLPWERERFLGGGWTPPDDPAWAHVVINDRAARALDERGIRAGVEPLRIDPAWAAGGHRHGTRGLLDVGDGERVLLQPSRALARKGVADGLALAAAAGATYWLTGPVEEGYEVELAEVLSAPPTRVLRGADQRGLSMADAYAAADAVVVASTWEGFGLPLLEAAVARRPLAVRRYPVAADLERAHGFAWLAVDDGPGLRRVMDHPDPAALDRNEAVVRDCFGVHALPGRLASILEAVL